MTMIVCAIAIPVLNESRIPDIVRHMSNLIVRAEKEVILATNFWQNGVASKYITNAIKELSRRAGERGTKIVVKILYDRGSPKQLLEPHYIVSEKEYTGKAVGLPAKQEIPNVDLEVMNYHDPMLGTFHSKFMVVDRKIGIVQSNNIQDNENLEMMVHVEGPIVDGLYDMALLSWHKKLQPPLPSHATPASEGGIGAFGPSHNSLFDENGKVKGWHAVVNPATESNGSRPQEAEAETNKTVNEPYAVGSTGASDPATDGYLKAGRQTVPENLLRDPPPGEDVPPESTADDPHYDVDIAGEVARVQRSVYTRRSPDEPALAGVTRHLNHTVNEGFPGDDDADPDPTAEGSRMTPYVPHPAHAPFPVALVNRHPHGPPNHHSVATPQNAAWLSALRNAQRTVFIQSPTLNAEPLVPAIIEACERGIDVYCYICLGYNDAVSFPRPFPSPPAFPQGLCRSSRVYILAYKFSRSSMLTYSPPGRTPPHARRAQRDGGKPAAHLTVGGGARAAALVVVRGTRPAATSAGGLGAPVVPHQAADRRRARRRRRLGQPGHAELVPQPGGQPADRQPRHLRRLDRRPPPQPEHAPLRRCGPRRWHLARSRRPRG